MCIDNPTPERAPSVDQKKLQEIHDKLEETENRLLTLCLQKGMGVDNPAAIFELSIMLNNAFVHNLPATLNERQRHIIENVRNRLNRRWS
jgi:hypothetical protein